MKNFDETLAETEGERGLNQSSPLELEAIRIKVGMDSDLLAFNMKQIVYCPLFNPVHLGISGPSGSGKTYCEKLLIGRIALYKQCEIVLLDYKGSDFTFCNGALRYFKYNAVLDGLEYVYNIMKFRMENADRFKYFHPVIMVWDEYVAALKMLNRQELTNVTNKISALLMLGRGLGICCILTMQRMDAQYFDTARINIGNILALGKLDPSSIKMCFPEYKDQINPQPRGKGYFLSDGQALKAVTIPRVKNIDKLHETIREALNRNFD